VWLGDGVGAPWGKGRRVARMSGGGGGETNWRWQSENGLTTKVLLDRLYRPGG